MLSRIGVARLEDCRVLPTLGIIQRRGGAVSGWHTACF